MKLKTYDGLITNLEAHQVFVYGSNPEGRHGAGTAKIAMIEHGAKYGKGRGHQGKSYGLVTKNLTMGFCEPSTGIIYTKVGPRSVSEMQIMNNIRELYEFALLNPHLEFMVAYTASNQNLNGYSALEMAEMFTHMEIPENMVFNNELALLMGNEDR